MYNEKSKDMKDRRKGGRVYYGGQQGPKERQLRYRERLGRLRQICEAMVEKSHFLICKSK